MIKSLYGWRNLYEYPRTKPSDKHDGPKISIVIPTLNQSSTLEDTILSITNQGYCNYEIILVDGGSTDNTKFIASKYKDYIAVFESKKDNGQSSAINRGFSYASGDIYAWLNSDDYYLPDAFEMVVSNYRRAHSFDVFVGAGDIVSFNSVFLKHIREMKMSYDHVLQWREDKWLMQQSCFWTCDLWNQVGGVDESLTLLMDIDLWLRFSRVAETVTTPATLAAMRYYPSAKSSFMRNKVKEEMGYIFAKNHEFDKVAELIHDLVEQNDRQKDELNQVRKSIKEKLSRALCRDKNT